MRNDDLDAVALRISRRRLVLGATLGGVAGAAAVAGILSVIAPLLAATVGVVAAAGLGTLWTPPPGAFNLPMTRGASRPAVADPSQDSVLEPGEPGIRHSPLGVVGGVHVTRAAIVVEAFAHSTAMRVEDLIWAYPIKPAPRLWIPFLGAALVLKGRDGSEVVARCRRDQVTPALSAIRYFAGHAALGWSEELAQTWAADREGFVAQVQARLGRVSGGGET